MTAFNQKIQTLLDKGQGPAARALDRLPRLAQESLAKILGYSYQYPDLDSFTKCMMAGQSKQGRGGFIGSEPLESRRAFDAQMQAIRPKPTDIEVVAYPYKAELSLLGIIILPLIKNCP